MVSLVKALGYHTSFSDIQEIGKYLGPRGWAKVIFSLGDVRTQITSRGLVYLEEKPDEFEEEAVSYLYDLSQEKGKTQQEFIIAISDETDDPKKNIDKMIEGLKNKIGERKGEDTDLLKDLEVIKIELSKSFPDFQLIEIKLRKLSTLEYISSEVQELEDYLLVPAN